MNANLYVGGGIDRVIALNPTDPALRLEPRIHGHRSFLRLSPRPRHPFARRRIVLPPGCRISWRCRRRH